MSDKLAPKKRGRKPTLDPEMVAAAMVELNGNISAVARRFNVHRFAVQNLIENRPALQKVLADIRKGMVDNVESRFYADCLKDGPQYQTSRIFFLKTQARERGYVERQEVKDVSDGEKQIVIYLPTPETETKERLIDGGATGDPA